MDDRIQHALRKIPPINTLLEYGEINALIEEHGRTLILNTLRAVTDEVKASIITSKTDESELSDATAYITNALKTKLKQNNKLNLRKVINATGIVIHTNLGRAPLPETAVIAMAKINSGYSNLEYDLKAGRRGSRHSHIESIICKLTGAEAAMVVNNNAAAVFLTLNTFSLNKGVIVSRGQQVEIGGSFRIPDIVVRSGASLIEVGTTNKTKASDYKNAITENTAVILKVHTSNYKIIGFTEEASTIELSEVCKANNLLFIEDLGSGSLYDLSLLGLNKEPLVQEVLASGVDLVTFSGDKLLGGPQAGIIAGKAELIEKLKKNPLTRMVRCDKSTIASLEAVLQLYTDTASVCDKVPVLNMLSQSAQSLKEKAEVLFKLLKESTGCNYYFKIVEVFDEVGGGSMPGTAMPGYAVAIVAKELQIMELQEQLRTAELPIIGRIYKDELLLSVRTIDTLEFDSIAEALLKIKA